MWNMRTTCISTGIIYLILLMPVAAIQAAGIDDPQPRTVAALRNLFEARIYATDSPPVLITAAVRFYEARRFQPAWVGPDGLGAQGASFIQNLKNAKGEAQADLIAYVAHLETVINEAQQLSAFLEAFPLEVLLQAEVGLTRIALYLAYQRNGDMALHERQNGYSPGLPKRQPAESLFASLPASTRGELIRAATPEHRAYHGLKKALERYETIRLLGGWPHIPEGPKLRLGMKDPRVPLLRKRLVICGDLGLESLGLNEVLDRSVAVGLSKFQNRHGLKADGVVGPKTLEELNIRVKERVRQIKLNMARWYGMPSRLGDRYLLVNIPGFTLKVVENQRVVQTMRAIVGKKERRTPLMSAKMTYLEINPYWNIPQKIAREDLLPKIHNDPLYLVRQKIEVFESWKKGAKAIDPMTIDWQQYSEAYFPFRLRQEPAANNALGLIKFMFPNPYAVYIHDTPSKSLFNKAQRSFSSGCVRIEHPVKLAEYLLTDQLWNTKKIRAKLSERKRKVVLLNNPIDVHMVYLTAWADEGGAVHFFKDLYGHDQRLLADLNRPTNYSPNFAVDQFSLGSLLENAGTSATRTSDPPAGGKFSSGNSKQSHSGKS